MADKINSPSTDPSHETESHGDDAVDDLEGPTRERLRRANA